MNIVVFEDEWVGRLEPLTSGRAAFAVSCAGFRLIDWLRQLDGNLVAEVRPHLKEVVRLDFPDVGQLSAEPPWSLLVNARLVPSVATFQALQELQKHEHPVRVVHEGCLQAAKLPTSMLSDRQPWLAESLCSGNETEIERLEVQLRNFAWLHDLVKFHGQELAAGLRYRVEHGEYQQIREGVYSRDATALDSLVATETDNGPIVLESDVQIGSFSVLRGPIFIDHHSRIHPHSVLKEAVSVGQHCRVGGEIEASTIEAFTNKQHHGFLGHSHLGSWINLGAGTCNSDLKNTYGTIQMNYGDKKVSTETQFLGCFIGDYVKTAINTSVFTGKRIGACSMIYGFVTTDAPAFVNYGRTFGKLTEIDPDVMVQTQARMFARRGVGQRACDMQLIRDMYELSRGDRAGLIKGPIQL